MDAYPLFPGFRDTDTSFEAAEKIAPAVSHLKKSVLATIKSSDGLTADEVADRLGLSILAIRPRVTELNKLGLIRDTGDRRANASGRGAIVWNAMS